MIRLAILGVLIIAIGCSDGAGRKDEKVFSAFKTVDTQAEKLSHADYNLIFDNSIVEGVPVELLEIGALNITTGQIVVCDPLVHPDMPPLSKTVPPGKYPVKVYVAKTPRSGDRYAIAKLEFNPIKADKWVLATRDGENLSELTEDADLFGIPVDAGVAGFFDYKTGKGYIKFMEEFMEANPNGNIYDDVFAAEFKKNAVPDNPNDIGDWVNFKLPNTDQNIMMFHSGYGDGFYPAYWGMTKDNEVVSLVIDFFVLLQLEEEKWRSQQ